MAGFYGGMLGLLVMLLYVPASLDHIEHVLQAAFPLHWPLVNSNHMRTKIAKQELETKRIEDDQRWQPFLLSLNTVLLHALLGKRCPSSVAQAVCCIPADRQRTKLVSSHCVGNLHLILKSSRNSTSSGH